MAITSAKTRQKSEHTLKRTELELHVELSKNLLRMRQKMKRGLAPGRGGWGGAVALHC